MPLFHISKSIFLRTLTEADAQILFSLVNENRSFLRQWLPWLDHNTSMDDSLKFINTSIDQQAKGMGTQYGIFYNEILVGMCGYQPINSLNHSVCLGYWVAEKMTGQGIVSRCSQCLIDYAFEKLKLNKVCILVAENNLKSRAIPERLGLVNEGIEREAECLYGEYVDHVRYSILKSDWKKI